MIKNWTVTTQAVHNGTDGLIARERYLLSSNHPNHRHTESLISIIGSKQTTQRIAIAGEQFRLNQKLKGTGGRPLSSYAMEFCLTLPAGCCPSTTQEWRKITVDCCLSLAKMLKLNASELSLYKSQVRAVLHIQKPKVKNTNSAQHVHLIIGKVVGNKVLKELQMKKGTKLIKSAFNTAVLKHTGYDHRNYQPHEINKGKRLEMWRYAHNRAEEAKKTFKMIEKLQNQVNKWFQSIDETDIKQQNRQYNRIKKSFDQLSEFSLSQTQLDQINLLKNKVNSLNIKI